MPTLVLYLPETNKINHVLVFPFEVFVDKPVTQCHNFSILSQKFELFEEISYDIQSKLLSAIAQKTPILFVSASLQKCRSFNTSVDHHATTMCNCEAPTYSSCLAFLHETGNITVPLRFFYLHDELGGSKDS